jgi:tetratricopeptide (TPR) repeat protein
VAVVCYRRQKAVCFFLVFLFTAFAPTANFFLLIGTIRANRFLYLPAVAFAGCAALVLGAAAQRLPRSRTAFAAMTAILCTLFAARTFARNFDWYNSETLWIATAKNAPDSARAYRSLADEWLAKKQYDRAIQEGERAVAILDPLPDDKNAGQMYTTLGSAYLLKGDSLADKSPDGSVRNTPRSDPWYRKALATLLRARQIDRANDELVRALSAAAGKPIAFGGYAPVYSLLGRTYLRLGDPANAIDALRPALVIKPQADLFDEIAAAYRAMNNSRQSEITLLEGVLFDLSNQRLAAELVEIYRRTEPQSCAVQISGGSPSLNFACPLVREQLCLAAHEVVQLHRDRGDNPAAAKMLNTAVGQLGCVASKMR